MCLCVSGRLSATLAASHSNGHSNVGRLDKTALIKHLVVSCLVGDCFNFARVIYLFFSYFAHICAAAQNANRESIKRRTYEKGETTTH